MQILSPERGGPSACRGLWFLLPYVRVAGLIGLCLIVVLSVIPGRMQIRTPAPKEWEHFAAYFLVASTLALGFGIRRPIFTTVVLMFMITVSGTLEMVQELVPGRTGRLADFEAGTLGAILGTVCAIVLRKLLEAKGSHS
jgi:VanZ family protein